MATIAAIPGDLPIACRLLARTFAVAASRNALMRAAIPPSQEESAIHPCMRGTIRITLTHSTNPSCRNFVRGSLLRRIDWSPANRATPCSIRLPTLSGGL